MELFSCLSNLNRRCEAKVPSFERSSPSGRALSPSRTEFPREALDRREKRLDQELEVEGSDAEGHIAFLILSDVPGRSTDSVAAPFTILSTRSGDVFVIHTTKEQLALARGFDVDNDLNNARWAGDVYRYFGQQPCWTEPMGMALASGKSEEMMEANPERGVY